MRIAFIAPMWAAFLSVAWASSEATADEAFRAFIPRASSTPVMDGRLTEYADAFSTPIEYFNPDVKNRAAQFFYLWDDDAFYVGARTLDKAPFAPLDLFWTGDAVEWYFDTRLAAAKDRLAWGPGAVHCFFTALKLDQVKPRFSLRPGYENAIPKVGIKVAAHRTGAGLEYEFKLPWSNFPDFRAAVGEAMHLDAELSYSDGVSRSFRSFVFGGPLSVDQPANLARVMLVEEFEQKHWKEAGPVMMPMRCDTAWNQDGEPRRHAYIAMPGNRNGDVGRIVFQLIGTSGQLLAEYAADESEVIEAQGNFVRRMARWPSSVAAPATYHVQAIVFDRAGVELTRVAPRLVSVNMEQGY